MKRIKRMKKADGSGSFFPISSSSSSSLLLFFS